MSESQRKCSLLQLLRALLHALLDGGLEHTREAVQQRCCFLMLLLLLKLLELLLLLLLFAVHTLAFTRTWSENVGEWSEGLLMCVPVDEMCVPVDVYQLMRPVDESVSCTPPAPPLLAH